MKAKKKLPIFLDIIKSSFLIIILILTIYTIVQTIIFGLFSSKYEAGQLFDTYRELSSIATDVGQGVSQEIFYEQITNLESRQNEEYIRIYTTNEIYYQTASDIWDNIGILNPNDYINIEYKFIDFERYILITRSLNLTIESFKLFCLLNTTSILASNSSIAKGLDI